MGLVAAENLASLDRIDSEILTILRDDAPYPLPTLGEHVHLSANAAADRVRRLVRIGVIRRFTIEIEQAKFGRDLEAVIDVRAATSAVPTWCASAPRSPGSPTSPAAPTTRCTSHAPAPTACNAS